MFFALSKILFLLLQPSSLALLVCATGLVLLRSERHRRVGYRLTLAGVGWIAFAGFVPVGNALVLPLEERFSTHMAKVPDGPVAGIILLGGFEDGWVSAGRGGLAVNEAGERLTEGLRLARAKPEAKVIFTGGVGNFVWGEDVERPVHDYLIDAGIARDRIVIEHLSRNTWENAIFTREIVKAKPGERWLLVTSAYHMPRSVGVFRQAGFDVLPYPVDFRTRDRGDLMRPFESMPRGLERLDLAAKEWIGLAAYWMSGKSSALFPGPVPP
jgi:uncharacterized SAM-binding protein YcdF (DUF218 family)